MKEFNGKDYLIGLIQEAIRRDAQLGNPYKNNFAPDFAQAQEALETPAVPGSQTALLLAAVRRKITLVEKKIVTLIISDKPITTQQMSHLVRIRLICTELLNTLSAMLEQIKLTMGKPGLSNSGMAGLR
jgi:hypothetical protein